MGGGSVAGISRNLGGGVCHFLIELAGSQEHDEVKRGLRILAVLGDGQRVGAGVSGSGLRTALHRGIVEQAPVDLGTSGVVDLGGDVVGTDDHRGLAEADLILAAGILVGCAVGEVAGVAQVNNLLRGGDSALRVCPAAVGVQLSDGVFTQVADQLVIESEVGVGAVLSDGGDAGILQLLAHIQEFGPSLRLGGDAGLGESILVIEDAAHLGLLGNGVEETGPLLHGVVEAGVAEAVVVDGCGHVGQVVGKVLINVGDTLIVVLKDVKLLAGLQGSGENFVDGAALPLHADLGAGLLLESSHGLLDDLALGLVRVPHGPHGQVHAVILLAGIAGLIVGRLAVAGQCWAPCCRWADCSVRLRRRIRPAGTGRGPVQGTG